MSLFDTVPNISAPQAPLEIADDTFLIRALTPSVGGSWTNSTRW